MKVTISNDFFPTPKQIVDYIWEEMDAEEQAQLIKELVLKRKEIGINFEKQLSYVTDWLEDFNDDKHLTLIEDYLDTLKEYLVDASREMRDNKK